VIEIVGGVDVEAEFARLAAADEAALPWI